MATRTDPDALTRAEEEALRRARDKVARGGDGATSRRGGGKDASAGARKGGGRRRGKRSARLQALDLLRGLAVAATVVLLAGTAPATLPPWAAPSPWHGYAPADLVLPAFLLAAGISLAYADAARARRPAWWRVLRIVRRTVVLVALGLGLSWLADPDGLRWSGLLQRVGLATLLGWLLTRAPRPWQIGGAVTVLVGWWYVLARVAVPGIGAGRFAPDANVVRWIDGTVVGAEHLVGPTDPLGLATTLPSALLVVAGVWLGSWLRVRPTGPATTAAMTVGGGWLVVLGVGWAQVTPLNATLWTPPYLLFATGVLLLCLAATYLVTEVLPVGRLLRPVLVLGRNPLAGYLLPAAVVAGLSRPGADGRAPWARTWESFFAPVFGDLGGLVLAAGLLAGTVWVVGVLDRRGWRLRA